MNHPNNRQRQVFVSFSLSESKSPVVEHVLSALSNEFDVLTGQKQVPSREPSQMIVNSIKESKSVVVILPEELGHWVRFELAMATSLGKATFLVVEEQRELPSLLDLEYVQVISYTKKQIEKLVRDLLSRLRRSATRKQRTLPRRRPERFEMLVARVFEAAGYRVTRQARGQHPHVDILASFEPPGLQSEVTMAIECKFLSKPVGPETVREATSRMPREPFVRMVVSNNRFTEAAKRTAEELGVIILDGLELERIAKESGAGPETITWIRAELESLRLSD